MAKWLELSKQAFEASSAFIESNHREDWDYSLRAFRGEHASGSKYLSEDYKARSRLFRPKTRSVIRKNEAAGAVALFSNMEVVDLQPGNPDDPMSVASRDAMKALLEYRLGTTLPTFEICMGGIQDAQTQGAVCSYQYWEYDKQRGIDKPCIELRPIENIRLDGGASWINPVASSPYFADIIPMYVCQVKGMMNRKDSKTGEPKWKKFEDSVILRAKPEIADELRRARLGRQQDPHIENQELKDFDTVWVIRWFMRNDQNDDFTYYTLGTEELLTEAKPLEEVYFHGIRPYEIGYAILETHKTFKTSVPSLVRPLQQEMNALANQRIDNVQFVLNKRWIVARGRQVDVNSLVRGVPGGVTLTTDPKTDVVESNWPDVTSSAYVEQDRLNADFDDVAGNFSPATKFANKGTNDTLGGARLASQGAGLMTDYLLMTIFQTWWERVLRQLVKLEAKYETDEKVLAIAARKAKLFPRYGLSNITDEMLNDDVTLTVNVGMGASNPDTRFQKLMVGTNAVMDTIAKAPPNFNVGEFIKEAFSNMGYRDGTRFWGQEDPRLAKAMQMIQQLGQQLKGKQMELQAQGQIEQQKLLSNERIKGAEIKVNYERIQGDLRIRQAELMVEREKIELERIKAQIELHGETEERNQRLLEASVKVEESMAKLAQERAKLEVEQQKVAVEGEKAQVEREKAQADREISRQEVAKSAIELETARQAVAGESERKAKTESISKEVAAARAEVQELRKGLGALLGMTMSPKKKPQKLTLKKGGKKTNAVVITFDDGSEEEMKVA